MPDLRLYIGKNIHFPTMTPENTIEIISFERMSLSGLKNLLERMKSEDEDRFKAVADLLHCYAHKWKDVPHEETDVLMFLSQMSVLIGRDRMTTLLNFSPTHISIPGTVIYLHDILTGRADCNGNMSESNNSNENSSQDQYNSDSYSDSLLYDYNLRYHHDTIFTKGDSVSVLDQLSHDLYLFYGIEPRPFPLQRSNSDFSINYLET